MNKEKFLKELEKKLSILSKEERKDILDEYEDIINEKMKHGKTEEEAVKEFGNITDLADEILESYKINPNYQKGKGFLDDCEEAIKKGAKTLSDVTEEVVESIKSSESEVTLETIFEIIIKIALLLLAFVVIHIPFWAIGELGKNFLSSDILFFGSFNIFSYSILGVAWKLLTEFAYLVLCALLAINVIKKYTQPKNTPKKPTSKGKPSKQEKEPKNEEVKSAEKKEDVVVPKRKPVKKNDHTAMQTLMDALLILIKIWVCLMFIIPLIICEITLVFVLAFAVYLLVKGVANYAFVILLLGLFAFMACLIKILCVALFTRKKIHFIGLFLSFLVIVFSGIFTAEYFLSFTFHDDIATAGYATKIDQYTETVEKPSDNVAPTRIRYNEFILDNSLKDGEVVIEVTYYKDFVTYNKHDEAPLKCDKEEDIKTCVRVRKITFPTAHDIHYSIRDLVNDTVITHLKEQKIYDYSNLFEPYITVRTNVETQNYIQPY